MRRCRQRRLRPGRFRRRNRLRRPRGLWLWNFDRAHDSGRFRAAKRKTSDVVGSVEAPQELWPSLAALDEDPCTTAITALRLLEKEQTIPPRTTVTEQPTEE